MMKNLLKKVLGAVSIASTAFSLNAKVDTIKLPDLNSRDIGPFSANHIKVDTRFSDALNEIYDNVATGEMMLINGIHDDNPLTKVVDDMEGEVSPIDYLGAINQRDKKTLRSVVFRMVHGGVDDFIARNKPYYMFAADENPEASFEASFVEEMGFIEEILKKHGVSAKEDLGLPVE